MIKYFSNFQKYMLFHKRIKAIYLKDLMNIALSLDLSVQEAELLLFFYQNPELNSSIDAVKLRGFSKAFVSLTLGSLVEKKLISCNVDKDDRRLKKVELSTKAKELAKELRKVQIAFIEKISGIFSKEEKEFLSICTEKLIDYINNYEEENDKK